MPFAFSEASEYKCNIYILPYDNITLSRLPKKLLAHWWHYCGEKKCVYVITTRY